MGVYHCALCEQDTGFRVNCESIGRVTMASGIVNTLKTKIKENAEELEKHQDITEETRNKFNAEKKHREETEAEVLAMNRKIKLLEDNLKRNEDRLDLMTGKSQTAPDNLQESKTKLLSQNK